MFDIGWSEMAVVALVAIIVIGPRDLPRVARAVGRWMGKARAMAREFQRSLDEMAREAELDQLRKELEKATRVDVRGEITRAVDPDGTLARSLEIGEDGKEAGRAAGTPAAADTAAKPVAPAEGTSAAPATVPAVASGSGTTRTNG